MYSKRQVGLYTILPFPILHGIYGNTGWPGDNTILRNRVGDEGGGVECPNKGGVYE